MKLTFRIQYLTTWGESLCVILEDKTKIMLSTTDGAMWQGSCDISPIEDDTPLRYRYAVYRDGKCVRMEFGAIAHSFFPPPGTHCVLDDCWRDLPADSYMYSLAFTGDIATAEEMEHADGAASRVVLRALCPGLRNSGRVLAVSGSCRGLGEWDAGAVRRMREIEPNVWHLELDSSSLASSFSYKFVAVDAVTGNIAEWENRGNRDLRLPPLQEGEVYLPAEAEAFFSSRSCRLAGTAIPVFSLRSEGSFGVGDFGDLKTFIDWAVMTGQRAVQLLPINDTTMTGRWIDSYPYSSISIYAFHPMYVDVRQLPCLKDESLAAGLEAKRLKLNALPQMDYEEVNRWKHVYLKALFEQERDNLLAGTGFREFFAENERWLKPYAAFCYLRDRFNTPDFNCWEEYAVYDAEKVDVLCDLESETFAEIAFYYFVQYELHVQLLSVSKHARSHGVVLKGDIPIGISRTSVEAWVEPYYFNMDGQAGAPPDAFSVKGQNWGMPTYNWKTMQQDGYQWWKRRFRKMADYFTAYRIDHILGFFRIWEIPIHSVHGLLGQFVPSLPMSAGEIESFGLHLQPEFMTRPFINDCMLDEMFGERADEVRNTFVRKLHHDIYEMKPEFDTQRKVEQYFASCGDAENDAALKEGLYALISNVLFVRDRDNSNMYHPRIAVQNDYIFRQLNWQEQDAFNRLYDHYYYHRHNQFWYGEAMKKLPVLTQTTSMLVCGEDLGMVPDCVPWVMEQLQILSLEIQRMPKDPSCEFGHTECYPVRSVCTIGTHDMSTFRGWWEEDRTLSARFFYNELRHWGDLPEKAPGWLCEDVVRRHLHSPSILCILTWQDWTSMDEALRNPDVAMERINVPANPHHYWRWRMHITLEELMKQYGFNAKIRAMVTESGR